MRSLVEEARAKAFAMVIDQLTAEGIEIEQGDEVAALQNAYVEGWMAIDEVRATLRQKTAPSA